jgi:hypothetical protein
MLIKTNYIIGDNLRKFHKDNELILAFALGD